VRDNFARVAEDLKTGDLVLSNSIKVSPQDIAIMAATGNTEVVVRKRPVVGIISTGSELVEPEVQPSVSRIRNSNSYQLMAQVEQAGGTGKYYGIAADDEMITFRIVAKAIAESDIVLITGGVSMGDFDFVPAVLKNAGVELLFTRVAIQPGKPTTFGIHNKSIVFGLPGNPVSSFISFELFTKPLIGRMMGYNNIPPQICLQMREQYSRRSADRMALIPVILNDDNSVSPAEYHGSAHISSLSGSFGIVMLPMGQTTIEKGALVNVRQFQ
jgi:molybdopterin molybdotransferase